MFPHAIDAIRVSKYNSIMLSVHDLLYGKLLNKYGEEMMAQKEDIHKCFSFDKNTTTFLDGGGLEFVSLYGQLIRDGIRDDPSYVYAFQKMIGADVWIILDYPTQKEAGIEENKKRINQTLDFAREINQIHNLPVSLMAVAHGYNQDSLVTCAKELAKLEKIQIIALPIKAEPFDSDDEDKFKTVQRIRNEIGQDKFIHLLGCGSMKKWPVYVLCGANSMDATNWLGSKANPRSMTWSKQDYKVGVSCNCNICRGEIVDDVCNRGHVFRLQHNLYFTEQVMNEIRDRFYAGTLIEYIKGWTPEYSTLVKHLEKRNKVGV
jgi:tRNA-guanine family transglycosylase